MKAIREDVLIDTIHDIDPDFPIDKLVDALNKQRGYVLFKCDRQHCSEFCNDECCLTTDLNNAKDFEIILLNDKPFVVQQKPNKYEYECGEQIVGVYSGDKQERIVHVRLTENEYQALVYLSKKTNISMSEIFRRGVDLLNVAELKIDLSGKYVRPTSKAGIRKNKNTKGEK